MRLWNLRDARIYEGSPAEILRQMQRVEPGVGHLTLTEYIAHRVDDAHHHWNVTLTVEGEDEEARAASLIASLITARLVQRIG